MTKFHANQTKKRENENADNGDEDDVENKFTFCSFFALPHTQKLATNFYYCFIIVLFIFLTEQKVIKTFIKTITIVATMWQNHAL